MRAIGRLFAAIIGFMLALPAASLFVLYAAFQTGPAPGEADPHYWMTFVLTWGLTTAAFGFLSLLPAAIFMLVTEILGVRSFMVHVGAGALLGAVGSAFADDGNATSHFGADQVFAMWLAAGIVGGFVYWIIAGRHAGIRADGPPEVPDQAAGR